MNPQPNNRTLVHPHRGRIPLGPKPGPVERAFAARRRRGEFAEGLFGPPPPLPWDDLPSFRRLMELALGRAVSVERAQDAIDAIREQARRSRQRGGRS